jgi:hypothetical protein
VWKEDSLPVALYLATQHLLCLTSRKCIYLESSNHHSRSWEPSRDTNCAAKNRSPDSWFIRRDNEALERSSLQSAFTHNEYSGTSVLSWNRSLLVFKLHLDDGNSSTLPPWRRPRQACLSSASSYPRSRSPTWSIGTVWESLSGSCRGGGVLSATSPAQISQDFSAHLVNSFESRLPCLVVDSIGSGVPRASYKPLECVGAGPRHLLVYVGEQHVCLRGLRSGIVSRVGAIFVGNRLFFLNTVGGLLRNAAHLLSCVVEVEEVWSATQVFSPTPPRHSKWKAETARFRYRGFDACAAAVREAARVISTKRS